MNRLREKVSGSGCEYCEYPVPDKFLTNYRNGIGCVRHLCTLCMYTRAEDSDMKAHMNFCTNAVLDQMGAFNE